MDKALQIPFLLGFINNVRHQGNISTMSDFDVFPITDILNPVNLTDQRRHLCKQ